MFSVIFIYKLRTKVQIISVGRGNLVVKVNKAEEVVV